MAGANPGVLYYDILLMVSVLLTGIYLFMWHKHFDVHITLVFVLVPVINLGYALLAHATVLPEALAANKVIYAGGCYLQLIVLLASLWWFRDYAPVINVIGVILSVGIRMLYRNGISPVFQQDADIRPLILAVLLSAVWFGSRANPQLKKHITPITLILISAVFGIVVYSI